MYTLFLTSVEVKRLIKIEDVIKAVETAFREKGLGRVQMPPKTYIFFDKYEGDLRTMAAYLEALDIAGVKVVNVHPKNPVEHKIPTVMAIIILVNPKTGFPLAIMDGTYITNLRTGAAAIASKYLAKERPEILGIIGAGAQGRSLLEAHLALFDSIREVRVYDANKEALENYVKEFEEKYKDRVKFVAHDNAREVVEHSDIVNTATPSRRPIVDASWVRRGQHFNCIGADAPRKQELDPKILKMGKIVVDDIEQALHGGELNVPYSQGLVSREDVYAELGEIVAGLKPGRTGEDEITIFSSTGLAVQDVSVAKLVYDRAKERGGGTSTDIVGLTPPPRWEGFAIL